LSYPYAVLDVFTDRALAGNPLAVVLEASGIDDARMQVIAREFNPSETVFSFLPTIASARVRTSPGARAAVRRAPDGRYRAPCLPEVEHRRHRQGGGDRV
jgi:hypothetical protein